MTPPPATKAGPADMLARRHSRAAAALVFLLVAGCGSMSTAGDDAACRSDADCVPATCCHATACVARDAAPECQNVACTMECRPETMDCGGGCSCDGGRCVARLAPPPPAADTLR